MSNDETISIQELRDRQDAILVQARSGTRYNVTYNGDLMGSVDPADPERSVRELFRSVLWARLRSQQVIDIDPWTRDELHEPDTDSRAAMDDERTIPIEAFGDHASLIEAAVEEGKRSVVTREGRPVAEIVPPDPDIAFRRRAWQALLDRLERQEVLNLPKITRDEIYEDV